MSLSDDTKRQRITAVLDAAERLIRAQGGALFTMRALATEAGLSQATPFNLLGSKSAIVHALLQRSIEALPRHGLPAAPLDAIFMGCDRLVQNYISDADYMRVLFRTLATTSGGPLRLAIDLWVQAVFAAMACGDLEPSAPPVLVAEQLEVTFLGTLALWIRGDLADVRLSPQYRHGVAVVLLAHASPQGQAPISRELRKCRSELLALPRLGSDPLT